MMQLDEERRIMEKDVQNTKQTAEQRVKEVDFSHKLIFLLFHSFP